MSARHLFCALLAAACALAVPAVAEAYRPFDGTHADVAPLGEFELELGPAQFYRQGQQSYLVAPALVLNLGVFESTELVVDAQDYVALGTRQSGIAKASLRNDDLLLKHVFREGTLQGKTGFSIAAEGGLLTPEVRHNSGLGASLDVITSYQWREAAFHWNEWLQFTRDHQPDLLTGVILEGPHAWRVRPVAELFYERDWGATHTASALLGAICSARETLAIDLGVRAARVGRESIAEIRFGLTWAIPSARSEAAAR